MSAFVDELARALATPMPRRRALRVIGGALVAISVPGVLRTPTALGGMTISRRTGICNPPCGGGSVSRSCVVNAAKDICFNQCAAPDSVTCCLKEGGRLVGIAGCPNGYRCPDPGERFECVCLKNCGGTCCKSNEFCANFQQKLCCERGWRGCDLECCKPNEECRKLRVGTGSKDVCTKRCPPNQAWCGKDRCCPPKWKCVNESTGHCERCWPNEEECGKKCCDKKTSRCCGKAGCCPNGRSCCNTGDTQLCCPQGQKCATPILPGAIGVSPGTKAICCPAERLNNRPKLCCPPGMVALNSPGFRTPPPGVPPDCCPRGQVCTSGSGKFCADFQSDPQNCGGCGTVCDSGVCSGGVCALA